MDQETEFEEATFLIQKEDKLPKPNPFIHRLNLDSNYDRFKLLFMSIFVLPFRVAGIIMCLLVAYAFASVGLWGVSNEELNAKPLQGWRKTFRWCLGFIGRTLMRCYGFQWVVIKGKQASHSEATVLVVGPHSSFFDAVAVWWSDVPGLVNRAENLQLPFFGKYITFTQPIYVWRDDPNSRQNTIQEIIRRAKSKDEWPQVMVFPEGTCSNRKCLITFKPGAFYPGVPVQPVIIRYPNRTDCVTWTWDGPGAIKMLWVTLCQFHNYCEIEYLPVYNPSPEEIADPRLYAFNVRQVMADALGVPVVDYTYDDCRLMHKAKSKSLPYNTGLIEFQTLRQELGVDLKKIEDQLLAQYANMAITDGLITLNDLAAYLLIPASEPSLIQLFNLFDKSGKGTVDFREYIIGYCLHVKPANTEETLQWAFKLFDESKKGHITCDDLVKALGSSLDLTSKEAARIFDHADVNHRGYITYEDFVSHAQKKPEYAQIFLSYQKSIKEGTRTSAAHPDKKKAE